jgi:hypothetical protein
MSSSIATSAGPIARPSFVARIPARGSRRTAAPPGDCQPLDRQSPRAWLPAAWCAGQGDCLMASTWIRRRSTRGGATRYRVEYRVGGRESRPKYGGTFKTKREAKVRRDYVAGELAALRVPDLRLIPQAPQRTLRAEAERWRRSRVDVSFGTQQTIPSRSPACSIGSAMCRSKRSTRRAWPNSSPNCTRLAFASRRSERR